MIQLLLTAALVLITLTAISLQKTYGHLPAKEVKRRAQKGDEIAQMLYRALAYGVSLVVLLWLLVGASSALLFYVMARWLPGPLAVLGIVGIVWFGFAWLPNTRLTGVGIAVARVITPVIAFVLRYAFPVLEWLGLVVKKRTARLVHTRLYQREDLLELLELQKAQADNRITKEELDIAMHALTFGTKHIGDIVIPRSHVKMVKAGDSIGPILLDELHASGHSRFPVYQDDPGKITGILYLRDLVKKHAPATTVDQAMRKTVHYVHEEQSLFDALQAFLRTKRHMFIVVNSFEEVVGVVTIEDVLEQIIGKHIVDEFDQYEDLRAVATRAADKIHKEQKHEGPLPSETTEVVQ